MIDSDIRRVVLRLRHEKGMTKRGIARALSISRRSVRKILKTGTDKVPKIEKSERALPYTERIHELYDECKGNLVRVHEILAEEEKDTPIELPYSTLTAFCRRHGIGTEPTKPKGRYHFKPGQEIQHDTSPHDVKIGGKIQRVQCASAVLCFSRMLYAQVYPTFNRFYCKVFLTEAFESFQGASEQIMIDNTHVVIAYGTGADAVPVPEMAAFADRFDTKFIAHEKGDANRSARVEGHFFYIERNFYPGRTFRDMNDLNNQLRQWCKEKNERFIKTIQAHPIELYQIERPHLKPLPAHIPEVYGLHQRIVDLEGYINLHTNSYSVPPSFISRRLEVRETKSRVAMFDGPRRVAEHRRQPEGLRKRSTLPEHCPEGRSRPKSWRHKKLPEETLLRSSGEHFVNFIDMLHKKEGRASRKIRRLHRFYMEYPSEPIKKALEDALIYSLTDLERIERMILRNVAGNYFRLSVK